MNGLAIAIGAISIAALLQHLFPSSGVWAKLDLSPWLTWHRGEVWRLATYAFLHSPDSAWHAVLNALALWAFGRKAAARWGTWRFLGFFLACASGAGVLASAWPLALDATGAAHMDLYASTVGASGAVFGVITAFSILDPARVLVRFARMPLRALYVAPAVLLITLAIDSRSVSHIAHLGGIATALVLLLGERVRDPVRDGPWTGHGSNVDSPRRSSGD